MAGSTACSASQRRRAFVEDVEISAVAENTSTTTSGDLGDDSQMLEIGQCSVDGGRRQSRARDKVGGGGEGMLLEQIVNAQRGSSPFALRRNALSVLREKIGDPHRRIEGLICRLRDAVEEEFEPRLPSAILAVILSYRGL